MTLSPADLTARVGRISATCAAKIDNGSPSALEAAYQALKGIKSGFRGNEATDSGHQVEPIAARQFARWHLSVPTEALWRPVWCETCGWHGRVRGSAAALCAHDITHHVRTTVYGRDTADGRQWMCATPDRIWTSEGENTVNVEIKSVGWGGARNWGDPADGYEGVDARYRAQVDWQNMVLRAAWAYVVAFDGTTCHVYRVDRDATREEALRAKCLAFWRRYEIEGATFEKPPAARRRPVGDAAIGRETGPNTSPTACAIDGAVAAGQRSA